MFGCFVLDVFSFGEFAVALISTKAATIIRNRLIVNAEALRTFVFFPIFPILYELSN